MTLAEDQKPLQQGIIDLLGALRAESLGDQVFDFFAEPEFFGSLQGPHSCLLKGGRGTGKTTLLRCLSYQGQWALRGEGAPLGSLAFYGFFWRINTNRVAAFDGPELQKSRWLKLFCHYVNLELVDLVLEFLDWSPTVGGDYDLSADACRELALSLNIGPADSVSGVRGSLRLARTSFQARLNNIADSDRDLGLSMLGAPVDLLFDHMRQHGLFQRKKFFFLIDEYENLLDYQQEVFNTLIKHSSDRYAFKIGVKEMGFRRRGTITNEQLSSPADYDVVSISERLRPKFDAFASRLVSSRLATIAKYSGVAVRPVTELFETLTLDQEAEKLGVSEFNDAFRRQLLSKDTSASIVSQFDALSPLQRYFIVTHASTRAKEVAAAIRGLASSEASWRRRYANYAFALLFGIRAGRPGPHKYYAGWRTICRLANTNVRYLLELVAGMLRQHVSLGRDLADAVAAEVQTDIAYEVGRKNLQELERETDQAASLVKLVLGLGRVFEVLAADATGHTPEVTQFVLPGSMDLGIGPGDIERRVRSLLDEAVNTLAIVRYPGSKLQQATSVRSYDYSLHPMFAALFGFSYRRKRKIEITEEELLAFISEPKWAITRVLMRQNRDPAAAPLPDQLRLFSGFYG